MPTTASLRPALTDHPGMTRSLLLIIALLSAIAPLATDLYLPAFPAMIDDLGTTAVGVQLSLTAFLLGSALGQLVFGPLSDRYGRVTPLIIGVIVCVVASAGAALAPTLAVLVAARLVQGLSAASGMVIGRAIITDVAEGPAAARAFSLSMLVVGVAPVVAPLAGGILAPALGWRGLLWVVTAIAALLLIGVIAIVRESHTPERRAHSAAARSNGVSPSAALRSRGFVANVLAMAFAFAVLMSFIAASPFVFQTILGLNTAEYGLLFGLHAIVLVAVSAMSARLSATVGPQRLLRIGVIVLLAASAGLTAIVLAGVPAVWFIAPLLIGVGSIGLILGNATALALDAARQAAGLGSAVLGALQFGLGAIVSPIVSAGGEHTAVPLALTMAACAAIATVACLLSPKMNGGGHAPH